jgi:hypothetical protein
MSSGPLVLSSSPNHQRTHGPLDMFILGGEPKLMNDFVVKIL